MKKLALGAAAAGGAAFAVRRCARKGRAMHQHCRQLIRGCCAPSTTGPQSR